MAALKMGSSSMVSWGCRGVSPPGHEGSSHPASGTTVWQLPFPLRAADTCLLLRSMTSARAAPGAWEGALQHQAPSDSGKEPGSKETGPGSWKWDRSLRKALPLTKLLKPGLYINCTWREHKSSMFWDTHQPSSTGFWPNNFTFTNFLVFSMASSEGQMISWHLSKHCSCPLLLLSAPKAKCQHSSMAVVWTLLCSYSLPTLQHCVILHP